MIPKSFPCLAPRLSLFSRELVRIGSALVRSGLGNLAQFRWRSRRCLHPLLRPANAGPQHDLRDGPVFHGLVAVLTIQEVGLVVLLSIFLRPRGPEGRALVRLLPLSSSSGLLKSSRSRFGRYRSRSDYSANIYAGETLLHTQSSVGAVCRHRSTGFL